MRESDTEVVEIVQKDYASLSATSARIEGYRDVLRGATLTLWAAAIGLGVNNSSAIPLVAAIPLVLVLGWAHIGLDYQHSVAQRRAIELEEIVQAYVRRVLESDRALEVETQERLDDLLAQYTFGWNLSARRPPARKVLAAANQGATWATVLYLILVASLVVACVAISKQALR